MKYSRGFTLIELLITITVMVILMTLAVVSLRSSMVNARDEERKNDAHALARGLERYYAEGHPEYGIEKGHYPGVNVIFYAHGFERTQFDPDQVPRFLETSLLPGVKEDAFHFSYNPSALTFQLTEWWGAPAPENPTIIESKTTIDTIIYEPMVYRPPDFWGPERWDLCFETDCQRFNLYYRTESDGQLHKIESEHQ